MIRILYLILTLNILHCSSPCSKVKPYSVVSYYALENKYEVHFATDTYKFDYDSTSFISGDPEGVTFYNDELKVLIQLFVGSKNPPGWLKHSFDFSEKNYSIREEIENTQIYDLVNIYGRSKKKGFQKIVHYIEYGQLEVIETQILTIDKLIVNIHIAKPVNSNDTIDVSKLGNRIINSFIIKRNKSL